MARFGYLSKAANKRETDGPDTTVWRHLQADPDRYIYEPVRRGVIDDAGEIIPESKLPDFVQKGMHDPKARMFDKSYNLKEAVLLDAEGKKLTLPTETWREYVTRRQRCLDLREKLAHGELRQINDLITHNLDLRQFAQDVIENSEGPELLRAFWQSIETITILDPTVGSGAFLFAALNILEPLYEACLDRMEAFLAELDQSGTKHRPEKYSDFKKVLEAIARHPNRKYFIYKTIIINNLYGVDIMDEAVEICKLRLFLKLVAQVDVAEKIEPLPDIDFNIRAGNTLVGYVKLDEVREAIQQTKLGSEKQSKLLFDNTLETIEEKAREVDRLFKAFRAQQTELGGEVTPADKEALKERLKDLEAELNRYLAGEYGVPVEAHGRAPRYAVPATRVAEPSGRIAMRPYDQWLASHKPFHWFIEFYGILQEGGFDVVIGNPPYVVYSSDKVGYLLDRQNYLTLDSKNLYAFIFERCLLLSKKASNSGLIVQLTFLTAENMPSLQGLLIKRGLVFALPFPRRPESVFEGVEMPVVIVLSSHFHQECFVTTRIMRFYNEERSHALNTASLYSHNVRLHHHRIAKIGSGLESKILSKMLNNAVKIEMLIQKGSSTFIYYQEACRYWVKACMGRPFFKRNGKSIPPPHGRIIGFQDQESTAFTACLLNSSLFYWYYSLLSDCEHINDGLVRSFSVPGSWQSVKWLDHHSQLALGMKLGAIRKQIKTKQGHVIDYEEMNAQEAKPYIDNIDKSLAKLYGLTYEELDYIVNYDIKYRMGRDTSAEEGSE